MADLQDFTSQASLTEPATIADVVTITGKGPWKTKSDGFLNVLFAKSLDWTNSLFQYDAEELQYIPEDIRGLRLYTVRGLKTGKIGGAEFHRIRKETILGLEGVVDVHLEDVFGNTRTVNVTSQSGVFIPPFILHTYTVQEDGGLLVIANTLFNPGNPHTHDTYSKQTFKQLQAHYQHLD